MQLACNLSAGNTRSIQQTQTFLSLSSTFTSNQHLNQFGCFSTKFKSFIRFRLLFSFFFFSSSSSCSIHCECCSLFAVLIQQQQQQQQHCKSSHQDQSFDGARLLRLSLAGSRLIGSFTCQTHSFSASTATATASIAAAAASSRLEPLNLERERTFAARKERVSSSALVRCCRCLFAVERASVTCSQRQVAYESRLASCYCHYQLGLAAAAAECAQLDDISWMATTIMSSN